MSEHLKKVLHNEDGLEITFLADDNGTRIEFKANLSFDLSSSDDVVVVVNGQGAQVDCQSPSFAVAQLANWSDLKQPVSLMIRVQEFFEGWELD